MDQGRSTPETAQCARLTFENPATDPWYGGIWGQDTPGNGVPEWAIHASIKGRIAVSTSHPH